MEEVLKHMNGINKSWMSSNDGNNQIRKLDTYIGQIKLTLMDALAITVNIIGLRRYIDGLTT